jgi:two-component system cell cycle sensor histidine kinase/response regulator CckA
MDLPADRPLPLPAVPLPAWDMRVAGGLFLAWIVLSHAGPMLELAPGVRAWYPPAALLAAACVLWGGRALVTIVAAQSALLLLLPAASAAMPHLLVVSALLKAIYWVASQLLRARHFDCSFSTPTDVARFATFFVAAGAAAAIFNTLDGVGLGGLTRPDGLLLLRGFWIGDVVAVVALAPALIVMVQWASARGAAGFPASIDRLRAGWTRGSLVRLLSIPFALVASATLAPSIGFFAFALCFLPLGWIALSHGARVAALANVILTLGAVSIIHSNAAVAPKGLEIQAFVGMLALTGLLVGSVADERERAFALLGDSEGRYRTLVELLPDPLLVHVDGRVLFANSAAASVLGARDAAALVGLSLASIGTPRSKEVIEERVSELSAGRPVPLTHHTLHRVDRSGVVEVESVSIPFDYQGKAAALTVARDVSDRVRLEEELRHAQRMEAVGRLAGGVAHDFNNLLTVIISYSELILAEAGNDPLLARDIGEIRGAADRAASLTRQLLSFSRRQVLQPAALEVNEVVRGAETLLRRLIGPEIEIVARLDPAAGTVFADRGQLEQVIMNLVVNARDAMPDGGTLTLETGGVSAAEAPAVARAASAAERFATIVVRDTGKGMDAETMRRIFDPFFTTKEVGRGTGLGLATVHGILQQSGGAIAVESDLGAGSEFRILLPAIAAAVAAHGRGISDGVRDAAPRGSGRVLLVEDDAAVREGVRRILHGAGYDIIEASDGSAAIDALSTRDGEVDLLLSDIAMPLLDGRELARVVRSQWPELPVILMSGFADPDVLERDVPGVTLLQKPLEAGTLVAAVRSAAMSGANGPAGRSRRV